MRTTHPASTPAVTPPSECLKAALSLNSYFLRYKAALLLSFHLSYLAADAAALTYKCSVLHRAPPSHIFISYISAYPTWLLRQRMLLHLRQ